MATTTKSKTGSASSARNEVFDMLKEDHAKAKKAFARFEKLDPEEDREEVEALVQQTCAELSVHMQLEEDCFYPAVYEPIGESDLIDEAEVEHNSAKSLIADLDEGGAAAEDDAKYAATFKVLGEYIQHHVKEEEGEIFKKLEKAKEVDWADLLEQMRSRRQELMAELMPEQAAEEGETESASNRTAARGRGRSRTEAERPAAMQSPDDEDAGER